MRHKHTSNLPQKAEFTTGKRLDRPNLSEKNVKILARHCRIKHAAVTATKGMQLSNPS
jgi:hypothetical protein